MIRSDEESGEDEQNDALRAKESSNSEEGEPGGKHPKFRTFSPYLVDCDKLLDRKFELAVWPGPPDDEGHHTEARMKLTGRDLRAMVEKGPPPEQEYGSSLGNCIRIGGCTYRCYEDRDQGAFALLATLLAGLQSADEEQRDLCAAALIGDIEFYLLASTEKRVELNTHHWYWMFAVVEGEGPDEVRTREFKFWHAGITDAEPLVAFFQSSAVEDEPRRHPETDAIGRARVVRHFQRFFRDNPAGSLWAAVFAQRARDDAELSRTLVLCLPEMPGIAADYLAHTLQRVQAAVVETLRTDQYEIQSAMADRIADRVQQSIGRLIARTGWVVALLVFVLAILLFAPH